MECIPLENAAPYIQWIYSIFGSCVYGYQDAFSILLGYASIFCWLNAQVPQMVENYQLGSADGLSLYLLYFWLAGDVGNMFSCVLNHQLPFQTYLAVYFVMTDLILLYQYFYFGNGEQAYSEQVLKLHNENDEEASLLLCDSPLEMVDSAARYGSTDHTKKSTSLFMGLVLFGCKFGMGSSLSTDTALTSNLIEYTGFNVSLGWLLAWMCTTFYLASRIPQIFKNYKRHSTQGLSLALFSFAVSGNVTYAASILLHPGHTTETIMKALPYVSGAIGTLFLDAIIFGQFIYYKRKHQVRNIATVLSRVPTTQ